MPTPKKGPRLGGSPAHQRLILSNLATQLFEHGRITTTESRARTLRPLAEKLITKAKRGDLHNRREVLKTVRDKSVVHALFTEIAPTFAERPGGYTRITKIAPRKGDNAPMAVIELVTEAYTPEAVVVEEEGRARRGRRAGSGRRGRGRGRVERHLRRHLERHVGLRRRLRRGAVGRGAGRGVRGRVQGLLTATPYDGPPPHEGGGPSSSPRARRRGQCCQACSTSRVASARPSPSRRTAAT